MSERPPQENPTGRRRRADDERRARAAITDPSSLSPAQISELLQELQAHQVQLEMQNEELRAFQAAAEEARDRYRRLYESVPVGYLTVDGESTIEDANPAAAQILGVGRAAVAGLHFSDFVAPEDQDAWDLLRRNLARSENTEGCELRLVGSGGASLHVEVVGLRQVEGEGQGGGASGTTRLALVDVTEQRAAERALRHAASQAALAEQRERRQLALDLHDDLGQTLQLASLRLKRFADSSEEARERGLQEISRLLDEARERVSSLSFQLSPPVLYDVGLVAAAEWLADDLERRYGLVVTVNQADEPETDEAARVTLYRALRELLVNVAKHSGVREAHVRIWQEGSAACLEVTDGGRGFDPAEARRGFGLLALRERVRHLGGSVTISSADGSGARVVICVPRPDEAEEETVRRRRGALA